MSFVVLVALIAVILIGCSVVCDVDPNDALSLMNEQIRLQHDQVRLLQAQVDMQQQQLKTMSNLLISSERESFMTPVLIAISSAAGSWLVLFVLRRLCKRYCARQNPEMPQTMQLLDFRDTSERARSIERLRSALELKSPASEYLSGESSPA